MRLPGKRSYQQPKARRELLGRVLQKLILASVLPGGFLSSACGRHLKTIVKTDITCQGPRKQDSGCPQPQKSEPRPPQTNPLTRQDAPSDGDITSKGAFLVNVGALDGLKG